MKKFLFLLLALIGFVHSFGQTITIWAKSDTICTGTTVYFTAYESMHYNHYQWLKNGIVVGSDSLYYTTNTLVNGDSIVCLLKNSSGGVVGTSNAIKMTVQSPDFTAGAITGPDTVCGNGASITLTDTVTGGFWLMKDSSFATIKNGIVTARYFGNAGDGFGEGAAAICYVKSNICKTDTAFHTVLVLQPPSVYVPNGYLCAGEYAHEAIPYQGKFLSYPPDVFQCYGDWDGNLVIITYSVGTFLLYNIDSNYCARDSAGDSITVYPFVSAGQIILPSNSICPGDSFLVKDTDSYEQSYASPRLWRCSNKDAVFDTATNYIKVLQAGIVTIYASVFGACNADTAKAILDISPIPQFTLKDDTICTSQGTIVVTTIFGANWKPGDSSIAHVDSSNGAISALQPGTTTINCTLNGCKSSKDLTVITCAEEVVAYPVPAIETLEIHTFEDGYQYYSVTNSLGQVIMTGTLAGRYDELDVRDLMPGIYFLRVWGNSVQQTLKFVKE